MYEKRKVGDVELIQPSEKYLAIVEETVQQHKSIIAYNTQLLETLKMMTVPVITGVPNE